MPTVVSRARREALAHVAHVGSLPNQPTHRDPNANRDPKAYRVMLPNQPPLTLTLNPTLKPFRDPKDNRMSNCCEYGACEVHVVKPMSRERPSSWRVPLRITKAHCTLEQHERRHEMVDSHAQPPSTLREMLGGDAC